MENPPTYVSPSSTRRDHLHIRGEHGTRKIMRAHAKGSPPHTWRTPVLERASFAFLRITSTYVENTSTAKETSGLEQDHLHIRGEHHQMLNLLLNAVGSPPHTWRTPK